MTVDLAVVGGTLATADGTVRAGLAVDNGRIATIGREADRPPAERTVDVGGNVVMPGVVDPHVHVDGFDSTDSYETGTAAAALGGVTSVINFA
jgi:dihydropyrimidinase